MSPTSSEPAATDARPDAAFRRTFALTVVALLVLCAAFLGLTLLQGPKLSSAQVDATRAIAQSGQLLRLFANQPVSAVDAGQVTIEPAIPFTVDTSGEVVSVTFGQPLRYDAEYTVTVEGVTATTADRESTWNYRFATSAPFVYYLDRGDETDAIVRTTVAGTERTVVWSAPGIQEFGMLGESIAIVTLSADRTSTLTLVDPRNSATEQITLPAVGAVTNLAAASTGDQIAFEFTSRDELAGDDYLRTLMRLELAGNRQPVVVPGLDGERLSVLDWMYVPGSTDLIAQGGDQSVVRISADGTILPLGQYAELDHVSIDGSVLTVSDVFGSTALHLDDLEQEGITPSPLDGEPTFGGELELLPDGTRVQRVIIPAPDGGMFESFVVVDDGTQARVVYQTVRHEGSIESFRISPNGQYAAIEVVPNVSTAQPDGYPLNGRAQSITTVVVDLATGALVRSVEGFGLVW